MGLFDAIRKFLGDEKAESDLERAFWEKVQNGEVEFDPESMCALCGWTLCTVCEGCTRASCPSHCTCEPGE